MYSVTSNSCKQFFPAHLNFMQTQEELQEKPFFQNYLQILSNQFGKDRFGTKGPLSFLSTSAAAFLFMPRLCLKRGTQQWEAQQGIIRVPEHAWDKHTCLRVWLSVQRFTLCTGLLIESWQQAPLTTHSLLILQQTGGGWHNFIWVIKLEYFLKTKKKWRGKKLLLCFFCYKRLWFRFLIVSSKTFSVSLRRQMFRVCVPMCLWKMFFLTNSKQ